MKKGSFIFFIPLLIGVIASLAGFIWWNLAITAPSKNAEEVRVVINKGMSSESIGKELAEAGVVRSAFAFKLYSQLNESTKSIPPGEFMIPQNLTLSEVIDYLKKGPKEYWVTIPEGLRKEEYPQRFIDAFSLDSESAKVFRAEFLSEAKSLEGFLFPDTYLFAPDVSASFVVNTMNQTFYKKVGNDYEAKAESLGLTLREAVVLASLIERETLTKDERPVVAGIAFNRLAIGMPLQMDASVQYDLGTKRCRGVNPSECDWWVPPLRADLQIESRYNTYTNQGLPPDPISNPGITSLMAVVAPESSEYYYYIHADGQIYYAETLDQHNANINKYLR